MPTLVINTLDPLSDTAANRLIRYGAFMRAVARRAVNVGIMEFSNGEPHPREAERVTWDPTRIGRDAAGIKPARILTEAT